MGRIKTKLIKARTRDVMRLHGEKVTKDFTENKTVLNGIAIIQSKKMRNAIAGYMTRLKKAQQ